MYQTKTLHTALSKRQDAGTVERERRGKIKKKKKKKDIMKSVSIHKDSKKPTSSQTIRFDCDKRGALEIETCLKMYLVKLMSPFLHMAARLK